MNVVLYLDRSNIRPGQAGALRAAANDLVEHVRTGPSRVIWYAISFDEDESTMTVAHLHPDVASLEQLMDLIAPKLGPFRDLLELEAIDVYGETVDSVVEKLTRKTQLLGGTLRLHRRVAETGLAVGDRSGPPSDGGR